MARSDSGDSGLRKTQPCMGSARPLGLEWLRSQGHRMEESPGSRSCGAFEATLGILYFILHANP